jgi:phosphomannomutase
VEKVTGGVIYPDLHYGRDALVGIVLFLSLLVERNLSVSKLRASYPDYFMSKNKINLVEGMDVEGSTKDLRKKLYQRNLQYGRWFENRL